jgi:hypothetical protein
MKREEGFRMKRIGNGPVWILYTVLFCLVSLGLTWMPSPQITMAQAGSAFDGARHTLDCAELNGMVIPATSIGLPTTGGLVTSTTVVPAAGTGAAAIGEYCKVLGEIYPVDPTAPKIKFQVDLPTSWNHKAMMFGGGGFDGSIPSVAGNVGFGPTDQLVPLGRGYATFGSDSGHQAGALGSQDCYFGLNDEALLNFTVEAPKKTRDAAVFIIKARKPGLVQHHVAMTDAFHRGSPQEPAQSSA